MFSAVYMAIMLALYYHYFVNVNKVFEYDSIF